MDQNYDPFDTLASYDPYDPYDEYFYLKEGRKGWKVGKQARVNNFGHKNGRGSKSRQFYPPSWKLCGKSWFEKYHRGDKIKPARSKVDYSDQNDECDFQHTEIVNNDTNNSIQPIILWTYIEPFSKIDCYVCYIDYAVGWKCHFCSCTLCTYCQIQWTLHNGYFTCPNCRRREGIEMVRRRP